MLETSNLRLRAVRNSDFEKLLELLNDHRVQKPFTTTYVVPLSFKVEETLRSRVDNALIYCIIETKDSNEWVGFIALLYPNEKNRDATLSFALSPEFWGRGYATEALRFFIDYSFRELALHRVSLLVKAYNAAAIKVYKKVGFVQEGVHRKASWADGKWNDIIPMAILDEDWIASQQGQ